MIYSGVRIERIDRANGAVEIFDRATAEEIPLKGPNDLVLDAQGGFYFSDLGKFAPTRWIVAQGITPRLQSAGRSPD